MFNVKRIGGVGLGLSFIVGVLIVPVFHRMHCADHHDAHDAAKCPVCQLTLTPIVTMASVIVPIAGFVKRGDAVPPQSFIIPLPWCDPTQARAPPMA
ncbi:MAG: hypothetical protein ABIH24_02360 [Verrucomicrobiota bacterium]